RRLLYLAVAYLVPFIEEERRRLGTAKAKAKGRVVLATVKGDVHDIGKNIVGVVLSCNNYEVVDLGVMVPTQKILHAAREEEADIIGLSGLITPSLDEMMHVAKEMQREGFETPLLIGGATTSKAHTAVKIEPCYQRGPTVYVTDASRAVGVVGSLLSDTQRDPYVEQVRTEYEQVRAQHKGKKERVARLSIADARANRTSIDWAAEPPAPVPNELGLTTFEDYPLENLVDVIDWTPFFKTWELHGRFPAILEDNVVGSQAVELYRDARKMLDEIVSKKLLRAKAVVGLWPANAVGDDIEIYDPQHPERNLGTLCCLRQQGTKARGRPNIALSDFIAPKETGLTDHIGGFAVTAGIGLEALVARYDADHDDYSSIMAKALADRFAEAFAEHLHQKLRQELWGYAPAENLDNDALIRESYRGIRPAPGYPACPDHTEKAKLFEILDATDRTTIRLTESFAMMPAASVSGLYFAHPKAAYFGVGKISPDQVQDYAQRKGVEVRFMEKWLAPNLAYDPSDTAISQAV
ncbi:MAG: vitamin B12 dependent-methionine synthase activation domain-containing protein, partial [Myxococcota bacterium]